MLPSIIFFIALGASLSYLHTNIKIVSGVQGWENEEITPWWLVAICLAWTAFFYLLQNR